MYIAHVRKSDGEEQFLKTHLLEVREICETIGRKFEMPNVFGLAGLLHDLGKYSDDFQTYLREAVANPTVPPKRGSVNHSTAGGKLLMDRYHKAASLTPVMIEMVANVIYSHHGKLHDFIDPIGKSPFLSRAKAEHIPMEIIQKRFFEEVMTDKELDDYVLQATTQLINYLKKHMPKLDLHHILHKVTTFLTITIYSALIDADRTNSRNFDENIMDDAPINVAERFQCYLQRLEQSLAALQKTAIPNDITKLRQKMSENCVNKASEPTGIFTLSIPTGGGKTLASLRFALKHAIEHGKERIIYVIPYTSIIEQNAQAVRELLQTDEILEHHSNVIKELNEPKTFEELILRRQLHNAKDNWDIPIIFTTNVQYLDTFYSGKSRNLRRMHNLTNAVVIFDEVQTIPVNCISMFNESINFLSKYANSTVVLCTATQPALQYVQRNIEASTEIIENLPSVEKAFKRTNVVMLDELESWTTDDLAVFIKERFKFLQSILIITNNKKTTKELYQKLSGEPYTFHLSTSMCSAHRKSTLSEMRQALTEGKKVLCVSTQLIEAGVDISFQCVMRSIAGVDSIAQAAGRCNRNGEVEQREVYVFQHAEENLTRLPTIQAGQRCAKYLLKDIKEQGIFDGELLSSKAIEHYFKQYYEQLSLHLDFPVKAFDYSIYELLFNNAVKQQGDFRVHLRQSFATAAKYFEVIEANSESILVPYAYGEELITQVISSSAIDYQTFLKKAQQYCVNVFPHELRALQQENLVRAVNFGSFRIWIAVEGTYDNQFGLTIKGDTSKNLLLI